MKECIHYLLSVTKRRHDTVQSGVVMFSYRVFSQVVLFSCHVHSPSNSFQFCHSYHQ